MKRSVTAMPSKRRKVEAEAEPTPEYDVRDGYRYVKPYVYKFKTHAKQRWFDRTLMDIFTSEFGAFSPDYYTMAIQSGRITLNGALTTPEARIKNGDLICHMTHRHEPPVIGEDISVVHETDDLVVVSKPSSVPTHPCGAYRFNSLHYIVLAARPDLKHLHIVHRLDRLTSGVVILAKTPAKARELSQCIADRTASKAYLARVRGAFPADLTPEWLAATQATAATRSSLAKLSLDSPTQLRIQCPLICRSHKDSVWGWADAGEDGKEAETVVELRHAGTATSVLFVKPVTGRTHQIRLHLQLIGLPIANDPCYGGVLHYGRKAPTSPPVARAPETASLDPRRDGESDDSFLQRTCDRCQNPRDTTDHHCACIWLHALEYKLAGDIFHVPPPTWAAADYVVVETTSSSAL
ncbi:RNA pseudouridylate synthase [Achlya hypogyna]|uniref:RNA pseudouridylate synthase n=1 Tax=Achlya hypogyna TaxID=1202772 RepID=A0A1V9Y9J3_ACHHY|nr:RNA pseudouridylate synthase [Achlya hypogyna]